jgi:uncharacterized metal-binding protein
MIALITCSGLSNTGQLTTQVATLLMSRHPATFTWVKAQKGLENIADAVEDADLILVIEGCSDHCASKKIIDVGIKADIHLVATELGIEKNGMAEVQWSDIEKVLAAVDQKITGG